MNKLLAEALVIEEPAEWALSWLVRGLTARRALLAARAVLGVARHWRRHERVRGDNGPAPNPAKPRGPFSEATRCDLLIFVPLTLEGHLIDEATGHYGYSHLAVDCGEVDLATGQRVMIESVPFTLVHRSFQDRYGQRPFIRVPVALPGTDPIQFRECILSRLGEPYDMLEALTWAKVDDPAKQICSDLPAACLSRRTMAELVRGYRAGRLRRHSISIHGKLPRRLSVFVSPNGFAQHLGAPPGRGIDEPDTQVRPRVGRRPLADWDPWPMVMGVSAVALVGLVVWWVRQWGERSGS